MNRVVNELDSIHFSIKKASALVKEIGRQVSLSTPFFYHGNSLLIELSTFYVRQEGIWFTVYGCLF